MSQGGVTDFLSELNDTVALDVLHEAQAKKSVLVFKLNDNPNPITTYIDKFSDNQVILSEFSEKINLPEKNEISFKFHIGTEVYFIKTIIFKKLERYYFDISSKVIQLKRRKHPRYLIPKKWPQSSQIIMTGPLANLLNCYVLDLSASGIRLELKSTEFAPKFKAEDIIKIKFQIYKRAEIQTQATIKFFTLKPDKTAIVGLEFKQLTPLQSEKIANIIEDIGLFESVNPKT